MDEHTEAALAALVPMRASIEAGRFIFCDAPSAEPGAACWSWLRDFIGVIYALIRANRLTNLRILFAYEERVER